MFMDMFPNNGLAGYQYYIPHCTFLVATGRLGPVVTIDNATGCLFCLLAT